MKKKKLNKQKDIKLLEKQFSRLESEIPSITCSSLNNTFNVIINNLNLLPDNKKVYAIKQLINILNDLEKYSVFPEIDAEIKKIKNLLIFNSKEIRTRSIDNSLSNNNSENNPQQNDKD